MSLFGHAGRAPPVDGLGIGKAVFAAAVGRHVEHRRQELAHLGQCAGERDARVEMGTEGEHDILGRLVGPPGDAGEDRNAEIVGEVEDVECPRMTAKEGSEPARIVEVEGIDIDLRRLDIGWLRRQIGVVLQDGRLLPGSIFQNIAAGSRITREEAMEAIRMAGMEEDLAQMPMGLETMLGEGAVTLSGGQRQRLMIARALVRKPKLIIFDEATSALDNETQATVTESLNRLHATRLVIAHRLSTIREADRIYVLDRGRVVEEGGFTQLLARDRLFRRLAARQMITPPDG